MLATQTEAPHEAKDVKKIKERLAQSLKALQKRYVASDSVVTSDDTDANLLCCALEAIFIHGIKSKYIRSESRSGNRKGDRRPLPQPFFWSLLKSVTHRDVITELEKISFVGTDVGRCRAWLRLALNHGLLECYLVSLFREASKLQAHYQPSALLLNLEEREVLLSYLQGLASLTFNLSYKSSVLNEWTTTPLALAGLCPLSQADLLDLPLNGGDPATSKPVCKDIWDTVSQSSGSSDALDVQRGCPVLLWRGSDLLQGSQTALRSSNLSLDTTGSSQLSSSLSSDSFLQGQDPRSPTGEHWSSCDLEAAINPNISTKTPQKDSLTDFRESRHCSQESAQEDSFVSSMGPSQFSETGIISDSEIQASNFGQLDSEPLETTTEMPSSGDDKCPPEVCNSASSELHSDIGLVSAVSEPAEPVEEVSVTVEPVQEEKPTESSEKSNADSVVHQCPRRSTGILSRKPSSDSLSHSYSWISDDDIYKPHLENLPDSDDAPVSPPSAEPTISPSRPCVVHRRQIGLSNPFRGLLKLGHLERRSAVGLWRDYYCELSPFEFRLYVNAEERICCENCSLVRCEDIRITSSEGRFDMIFPGKRLYLRAANHDEAEDWVDRIIEAVNKSRPVPHEEQWEVLHVGCENGVDEHAGSSPPLAPSSPDQGPSGSDACGGQDSPSPSQQEFDWTSAAVLETDSIKEAVLYFSTDPEARTWERMVFSLSLETLKGFLVKERRKLQRLNYPVEEIRDVVPDVSLGGPAFFKLLTIRETLRFRAENEEEARFWRKFIRDALDSYLENGECEGSEVPLKATGNLYRLVQHRLKEDGALLVHLCKVPSEKGLDTQSFKCAGCPQKIGLSLGRARLCEFSGQYYCESCHKGDTSIIPSRMVHNWDVTQREVSKKALWLLKQVEQEPLLNLEQLNPELVAHAESMGQAHEQRQKLCLLGEYLRTCRSGACKKLQARMGQRTYLLESKHLYSVKDLRQVAEGQYVNFLRTLVQHASNHVFSCDLCTQRGYICQICHSNDTIFPFQFERTTRCEDCKALFHISCKSDGQSCPRCQRMRKYMERDLQD